MTTIHNHLLPLTQWTVEDSNVLTKLKLKREKTIPTPTEIRQNLGPRLADAVFSNLCVTTKKIVGLGKELDGPGVELWSQPKRQLLGEIILEQFPSRRHRQALTHQAILDYGEKCMAEWENNVAAQRDVEIQEKIRELMKEMNEQMEMKINQIRTKEREDFLVRIAMMEERLEKRHQKEMEALEVKLTEEKDNKIAEVMETMNNSHQHETELLLDASKTLLTNRFHFKINWIKADLEEDYNTKINTQIKILKKKFKEEITIDKTTDLEAVKNKMLQNVVCTACLTADYLLKEFHQKVETLKKEINELNDCNACLVNEIRRLEEENELCFMQVKSWECVVKDIVTQFQKFIEFNLKLPQGGANYLISWDKVFQLKNTIYDKMINKKRTGKSQILPVIDVHKSLSVQPEEESSISSAGICESIDMISIISSIIRRVIPSLPDLAEAEAEVSKILASILKQVIPSSSSLLVEEQKEESSSIPKIYVDYRLCPKLQRSQQEKKESSVELSPANSDLHKRCIDKEKPAQALDDQLQNRISEITKIMDDHPNILKFIQGP